ARGLVDGPVDMFEEVLRLEEIRNPVKRVVVDQNGAEKTPFRFDVVRSGAVGWRCRIRRKLQDVRISHGSRSLTDFSGMGHAYAPLRRMAKAMLHPLCPIPT